MDLSTVLLEESNHLVFEGVSRDQLVVLFIIEEVLLVPLSIVVNSEDQVVDWRALLKNIQLP